MPRGLYESQCLHNPVTVSIYSKVTQQEYLYSKNNHFIFSLGGYICLMDLGFLWNIYDCFSPPSHDTKSINMHTIHFVLHTLNGTFLNTDIAPHLLHISIPRSSLDKLTLDFLAASNPLTFPSQILAITLFKRFLKELPQFLQLQRCDLMSSDPHPGTLRLIS